MRELRVVLADTHVPPCLNTPELKGGFTMKASASVLVLSFLSVGCATQQDLWRAQENIVANDNRLAQSLGQQHEEILTGSASSLRTEIEDLRRQNQLVSDRARQIADEATSARTVAADAIEGLERYVGSLGGPLGGAVGAAIEHVASGVRSQDTRLIAVETQARASTARVENIESSLDDRIRSELLTLGLTDEQAGVLQNTLGTDELIALLAILGLSTGTGAFAAKVGKSRSSVQVAELQRRVESIAQNRPPSA